MTHLHHAVIGVNGRGRAHVDWARSHPRAALAAVVDIDLPAAQAVALQTDARAYRDINALLADVSRGALAVDAVSIATPNSIAPAIAQACLEAGLHVFMEKPFVIRVSQADALVALAAERGLKIGVGFQRRTYETPRRLKRLLDSGAIGRLQSALWSWHEFRSGRYHERRPWTTTWAGSGGGLLTNQVSHDLDLLRWMVGPVRRVSAMLGNQLHAGAAPDVVLANLELAGGALAQFQASINAPRTGSMRQFVGDRGALLIRDVQSLRQDVPDTIMLGVYAQPTAQSLGGTPGEHEQPAVRWRTLRSKRQAATWLRSLPGAHTAAQVWRRLRGRGSQASRRSPLFDSFVAAALDGGEPLVSGADALLTVELINAIILSAASGATVDLPLDRAAFDAVFDALCHGDLAIPRWR